MSIPNVLGQTPGFNGYGVTLDDKPKPKSGGGLMNAFSKVMEFGAPEAFEAGRQKKYRRNLSNAFKAGDMNAASDALFDMGQYDAGMGLRDSVQAQQGAQQSEKARMAYEMTKGLMNEPDVMKRVQLAQQMSQQLGLPAPTDPSEFTNEAIAQNLEMMRIKGGFEEEQSEVQAPIKVGERLVDPNTFETLYEPPAAQMTPYQKAQIALNNSKLAFEKSKYSQSQQAEGQDQWSLVPTGEGNSVMYNRRTGETKQFGGQPDSLAPQAGGAFDDYSSPFDEIDTFGNGGGQFILTGGGVRDGFSDGEAGGKFGDAGPGLTTGGQGFPTNRKPTDYDKTRDREMAKDLTEWTLGGQATAASQLRRLKDVIITLESGQNVSGKFVGNLPLQSITAPQAKDVRDTVGSVVQQSLRAILGGQFAQAEADQLLKRAYDPGMDEAINAKRLKILYDELVYRSKMNDYAARYADQHGTLEGFDGYLPQIGDFFATERDPVNPFKTAIETGQQLQSPTDMSDDQILQSLGLN